MPEERKIQPNDQIPEVNQQDSGLEERTEGQPSPLPKTKKLGINENSFKRQLFFILLGSKLILIFKLFLEWQTGGYSIEEFVSTLGLLIPVYATYTGVMFKDLIGDRYVGRDVAEPKRLRRNFQFTAYLVCLLYLISLWVIIEVRAKGTMEYAQAMGLITTVESGLGVYIGQIVFALFKRENL